MGLAAPFRVAGRHRLRAAVTGERERNATYDMVLEYSVPYLNRLVRNPDTSFDQERNLHRGHSSRAILGNMYPFVEFNGSTPVGGTSGSSAAFSDPGRLT